MGDAGFFKGTSADQDSRFSNKEKKLLKSMNFPPEFDQKVDMRKVNLDVIRPWISNRITEMLGLEDEVVIDYTCSLLEEEKVDPKRMQFNLTGFFEGKTKTFMTELWNLLLSAQASVGGIPAQFIEQKKEELRKKKAEEDQRRAQRDDVMDTIRRKRTEEIDDLHETRKRRSRFDQRERSRSRERRRFSRSPPRRRSRSPPRRHSRSPPRRYSRSPPRRHRSRSREDKRRHHDDHYESRRRR